MPFGFSFNNGADDSRSGWAKITIWLGDHVEQSVAQIGAWTKRDYITHWEEARLSCVRRDLFVVFCSSLSASRDDLTTLWIGRRTDGGYRFFNSLAPHDHVRRSGSLLSLSDDNDFGPEHDEGVSTWDVRLSDIVR